jgi:hypothetical protein
MSRPHRKGWKYSFIFHAGVRAKNNQNDTEEEIRHKHEYSNDLIYETNSKGGMGFALKLRHPNRMILVLILTMLLTYHHMNASSRIIQRSIAGVDTEPNVRNQSTSHILSDGTRMGNEAKQSKYPLTTNKFNRTDPILYQNNNDIACDDGLKAILDPILKKGTMYSVCRGDRSGSVIADMMYAHAFAYAHNITYSGNCCVTRGLPKIETRTLIDSLRWDTILPFRCPSGVDNKRYNLIRPNATTISPLLLNPEVYRLHGEQSNFNLAWRQYIQNELYQYSDHRTERPFQIAVHVRRGDVTPCRNRRRYLPNSHYLALIDQYTPNATILDGRPVEVTIYSESVSYESFDVFEDRNYKLVLDTEDLALVWKALSTADVAILSRSFFSTVPAAINPNTVVVTEFSNADVLYLEGWEYANTSLVKDSDAMTQRLGVNRCQ